MKPANKKRCLSLLLALCLLLTLFGCGQQTPSQEEPSSQQPPSSQEEPDEVLHPLESVLRQFPSALVDERINHIYPIQGNSEGFLIGTETGNLFYCQGETGVCSLLRSSSPPQDWDFIAGMVKTGTDEADTLKIVSREGVSLWRLEGGWADQWLSPLPEEKRFNFSYNFPKDLLFWVDDARSDLRYGGWDSQGTVIWESTLGENTGPYPSIDDEGHRVVAWATTPVFSASGKLAFFSEMTPSYEEKPILYDLETGDHWAVAAPFQAPAAIRCMVGETAVLACYTETEGDQGWDEITIIDVEDQDNWEAAAERLDFSYVYCYPGETGLALVDRVGNLYRWDLATRQSEMIYRAENPRVTVSQVVSTAKFDAVMLVEAFSNATAVAILPVEGSESAGSAPAVGPEGAESAAAVYARKLEYISDPEDPQVRFRHDTEVVGTGEDAKRCREIFSIKKDDLGKLVIYSETLGEGFADNSDEAVAQRLDDCLRIARRTSLVPIQEIPEQDPRALTRGVVSYAFYDKDGSRLCLLRWHGDLCWTELPDSENILVFRGTLGEARGSELAAQIALEKLLSCTEKQAEEFYAIALPDPGESVGIAPAPQGIEDYFSALFGDYMTEECIWELTANRTFAQCISLARQYGSYIAPYDLELTQRDGESGLYSFSARLKTFAGDEAALAFGTIQVENAGDRWMASNITATIK